MPFTVSQVARAARVSVRTLHHYDDIGLLQPSSRSDAGYRLYSYSDLEKLQQIMFFRELGFSLDDIKSTLSDPKLDLKSTLLMQRKLLIEQSARTHALIEAVDAAIAASAKGEVMESEKLFEAFDPSKYEDEAKARWGQSEAFKESARRTAKYTKADWEAFHAGFDAIHADLAKLMEAGVAATDACAKAVAERHRLHLERWFYPCNHEFHCALGEMYVSDPRFTANIDRHRAGLSAFLRDAIVANSET